MWSLFPFQSSIYKLGECGPTPFLIGPRVSPPSAIFHGTLQILESTMRMDLLFNLLLVDGPGKFTGYGGILVGESIPRQ